MDATNLLKLIKQRKTARRYKKKIIPASKLQMILEAGRWGPSVLGKQSWKFVVIADEEKREQIAQICAARAKKSAVSANLLLNAAVHNIKNCQIVICVYGTGEISDLAQRFNFRFRKFAEMAEVASAAACIQNMILLAEALNIGVCWHDIPLICARSISKLLEERFKLIAVLTVGYSFKKARRTKRKLRKKTIRMLKGYE